MDNGEVLELTTNFRSSGGLLDFINDNFSKILVRPEDRKSISVDYTDMYKSEKKADANFNTSNWEVNSTLSDEDKKPKVGITRPREAFMVAKNISNMIETKKYSAGDFLVLFKTSTAMEEYEKQLRLLDIPVVNTKSKNFLKRAEVIELLNLLALCAFPKEKFYRTCINHSELIKIDSESLDRVLTLESDFESKFRICCNLSGFSALAVDSNEDQYLQFIENLCALANTELQANNYNLKATFNNLFEKAVNDSFFSGIKINDESVHLQTRKANAVTLMTIHASKGLESRVVIMSSHDAGAFSATQYVDRKNQTILAETAFLSKKIAEGLNLTEVQEYYQLAENKRDEEDKRVLYVGVTRAEEEFVLITHEDGKNKSFISMLLDQNPSFKETVTLNFEDYEKDFNNTQGHKAIKIQARTNSFSTKTMTDLVDTQNISKSVTELIDNPDLFKNIEGRKDGKEFGTFTHLVMEYVCNIIFNNKKCDIDTNKLIDKLYDGYGTKFEPKYMIELKDVVSRFLASDLSKEIISAKAIHTELSFVSAEKYHGIIDLIIETDKELKIIDFKSDLLNSKKEEIMNHYKKQIGFYVKALGGDIQTPVVGECFYLFAV
jgi:ATP-dependent exoDNAse (exonuclease V) beta subunit